TCSLFREFAPNKKWAVSPLISPPAGLPTANTADKLVRIPRILLIARKLNVRRQFAVCFSPNVRSRRVFPSEINGGNSRRPMRKAVSICHCGDEVNVYYWMFFEAEVGAEKGRWSRGPGGGSCPRIGPNTRLKQRLNGNCRLIGQSKKRLLYAISASKCKYLRRLSKMSRIRRRGCEVCSMPQIGDCRWCSSTKH